MAGANTSDPGANCYGSGNALKGIVVDSACQFIYANKPTVTGTGGDTTIGGVATAYAAVPAITAANGAGIVLLA